MRIYPVFIPHAGCPHRCLYCQQQRTVGSDRTPSPADVSRDAAPLGLLREIESVHHALLSLHLAREPRSAKVVRELRPES